MSVSRLSSIASTDIDVRQSWRASGWRAAVPCGALALGLFSTLLVVVGGTLAGAAGQEPAQRLWSVPAVPVRPRVDLLGALVIFYAGLIFLVRAWLKLRRDVRARGGSAAMVALVVSVWALPLLAGPPLGSRDVYAYAAQGRLADAGFDVYRQGPAALGDDPILDPVDPLYLDAPVVYGPVFVAVSSLVSSTVSSRVESTPGEQVVYQVLAFRALAVLGVLVTAAGVWHIAKGLGRDPVDAVVLAVANPLVLLHLVSGAHNEALMLAFLVGGVAIGLRPRWRLVGIALCAFAAAIKMPGILGAAFLAWPWILEAARPSRRIARTLIAGGEAFAVIALSGRITGWGWGWVDALINAAPVDAYLSVTRVLGGAVQLATGLDAVRVLSVARMMGLLLAAVLTAWLLFRRKGSAVTALAWSLLLLAVLHPTTQPWYLTWGLMLWAAASAGDQNRAYLTITAVAAFVVLPVGPQAGVVLLENNGVASMLLAALALGLLTFSPSTVGRGAGAVRPTLPSGEHRRVTVIVPTRNEAESVAPLADRLLAAFSETDDLEIIFVDDSDDTTPQVLADLGARCRAVRWIHRMPSERWGGLGGAVVEGLLSARGATVVVMDGDLQHPPEVVPSLVQRSVAMAGIAVASRHVTGGASVGLSPTRQVLSAAATFLARLVFPRSVGRVSDPMSGFFALPRAQIDFERLQPDGFKILMEMLATHPQLPVVEVPYRFDVRAAGVSKASLAQASRYAGHLIDLRLRTSRPWAGAVDRERVFQPG